MSAQAAAERAELLKVARHPKTFTDEQWTQMRTRWREQLKREAEKVRVAREQEDAAYEARRLVDTSRPLGANGYLPGLGKHAYGRLARRQAIRELFLP